jgi:hypothetical protein
MQLGNKNWSRICANRLGRVGLYLALAIFVIQLLGLGFHRHDVTEEHDDCASCVMAAHLPSGTPAVSLDVAPTVALLFYTIAAVSFYVFLAQQSYLIPLSQAPPRLSLQ